MKNRPTRIARTADRRRRSFAFHPLSVAICLGFSGAALAAPQGGTVVAGQATITQPSSTSQIINQTTHKAIIDWKSFSIAGGEKVRFNQPSSTSVTLNRVTGYDPSSILGEMSSNGKIFLVNPYGVVFGAGARVDVGGLVVSSLSIANSDFLASRYSLTSVEPGAPGQRGEVRNEGTISAPGGTVVLAGPTVTNTGTIVANGGRVGMVAANAVSVDVEGDGLLFFQTSATDAKNRLQQLGRIQADGGSIEMRAAARGAFADTVLNMTGIVQAKTIGSREGRIVIDGGGEGIVAVAGKLDATGLAAGARGGSVSVEGQRVLLDNRSVVDASGSAGGGAIRIGGDFHGANAEIRNADATVVAAGAVLRADAVDQGHGGTVAIWSDGLTRYQGSVSARGGERGGDGGFVEVSGKQSLVYDGKVDTRAPKGVTGTLLLDPTDITIDETQVENPTVVNTAGVFTDPTTSPSNIKASTLTAQLATTDVIVDTTSALPGTGTITIKSDVLWSNASNLTFKALSSLTLNAGIQLRNSGSGDLNLQANGAVVLNGPVTLVTGDLFVSNFAGATTGATGAASFTTGAAGTITTAGGNVTIRTIGDVSLGAAVVANGGNGGTPRNAGNVTITAADGAISTGTLTANGGVGSTIAGGAVGGRGGDINLTVNGSGHTLNTGVISSVGGKASDNSTNNSDGSTGGGGGTVTLANLSGASTTVAAITASGGNGGAGGNGSSDGGDGGAGGGISISSSGGNVTVANLTTVGGTEAAGKGSGNDGNPGAGGAVTLTFAQTAPGRLDVSASTITAGSASATGVPANATLGLNDGAENVTLASALLTRSTSGNLTLSGITNADITSGTGTFNASGFAGNVAIQYTAGSGQITGNGANTTLTGLAGGSAFVINAANGGGTLDTTTIGGIGNLAGGAGVDTFAVSGSGTLAGSITGGGGANTLAVTTATANFVLATANSGTVSNVGGGYSGIASLTGNATTSTLTGTSAPSTFSITSPGTGNVNGTTTFTGMASLAGGIGADSFVFTGTGALVGGVDGGTGATNTLDLQALGTANFTLTSSATTGTASPLGAAGFSNVGSLVGNNTSSTLTGRNVASTWTVTGNNAGNVNDGSGTTNFTGVAGLVGGSAADAFVLGAGFAVTSIDGGTGSNSVTATASGAEDITLSNILLDRSVAADVTLVNIGTATLIGGALNNTLDGQAFSGNLTLQLSAGSDTLIGNATNTTLLAAPGGSSITVDNPGKGSIGGGGTFDKVTAITGGAGVDTFFLTGAGSLTGALTGVGGNDTLDVSGIAATLTINQQSGTITGVPVGSISGITTFKGNGANTSFLGDNVPQTYSITGGDAFTVASQNYTNVGSIKGGTANDTFQLQPLGTLSGTLDGGGGGVDTLNLAALGTANFTLTSSTAGTASGITGGYLNIATLIGNGVTSSLTGTNTASTYAVAGGGSGTVNDGVGTTNFSGIVSLVGGTGADQFQVANAGSLAGSINGGGGAGVNTLDLSLRTTADFGLVSASAGNASGITGGYTNIATLKGNDTTSTLTGTNTGSNYAVTSPGSGTVNDGVGTTTFSGIASLAGGTGADNFALSLTGTLAGSVDGGGGAGVNTLDLSGKASADFVLSSASSGSASNLAGGYSNVTTVVGNSSSTTLTGSGTSSIFTITGNGIGSVNDGLGTTTFQNVFSLAGGSAADSFRFSGVGTLGGNLNGGTGAANTLDLSLVAGAANFTLAAANAGTASPISGSWSNIGTLLGNGTTSTLTGRDLATTWTVTGNNAGSVTDSTGTITFSATPRLVGGSAADAFVVNPGFALASIDGGSGSNSLAATSAAGENLTLVDALLTRSASTPITLAGISSATLTGDAGNNIIVGTGFSGTLSLGVTTGTDSLTGNGANTTLVTPIGGTTVNVTALNQGSAMGGATTFSQVGNLRGNTGPDTFAFAGAGLLLGGNVTGVGGNDTLDLSARIGAVTISQSGTTTGSGVGGTVTGVTDFIGNGASTTFLGGNLTQTYNVTGPDLFSVGGQNLINVGSIQAGNLNDTFVLAAAGSLSGALDGGAGSNTLNLAALGSANFTLTSGNAGTASGISGGYLNIATLIGNGVTSSLTGSNTGSTYVVAGPNSGTVNDGVATTNFSGVANLTGGTGADVFQVGNAGLLTGTIAGGGGAGVNTLDLSPRAIADFGLASASSGSATGITGGYSAITTLVGNGSSTLTGTNNASTFAVGGNGSGTVTDLSGTTAFSGVGSLAGGAGGDVFALSNGGSLTGNVNGGAGINALDLSGRTTADFGLASSSSGTVSGVTGGYSNVTTLAGNGSTSTLTGTNTGSTYAVTSAGAGTVFDGIGITNFSGIASLAGGTGADAFTLSGTGSLAGSVNGGGGGNSLTLTTATANFGLSSASSGTASNVGGGYSNVTSLTGNGASSTLTGTNTPSTWSVAGNNAGTVNDGSGTTTFAAVPNLVGGTGADAFVVGAGIAIGSIDGGSGAANTLAATALTSENLTLTDTQLTRSGSTTIVLANIGAATLTGGSGSNVITASGWTGGRTLTVQATSGNDTVTGNGVGTTLVGTASPSTFNVAGADSGTLTDGVNTTTYGGVGNLTGGASNDTFRIQDAGTLTGNVDGGGGTNTLDLSNKTSATIVFSSAGNSVTGVGIAGSLSNITNLIGNSTNTTLQGDNAGQSFVITANNEITVGGTQVFQGVGSLAAGTGPDSISGSTPFKLSGSISDAGGATTLSGTIQTDGSQTYLGAVTAPSVTLIALGGLTATNPANNFGSASLTGGAINVRDVDAIDLLAVTVGAGQTLAINSGSTVTLHGDVATTADQTWTGNLLFASDATLSAGPGSIAVSGNVDGGTHNLALASANAGASALSIGGTVGNVATFAANGNARLSGNVISSDTQTYTGAVALTGDVVLDAGTGKVDLQRAVDGGGHNLTLTSGNAAADAVHLGSTVGNTVQLTVNGPSTLGGNVSTSGNQRYNGPVTLAADVALDAGAALVDVQGNVNGGTHNFTLASSASAANATTLNGSVANVGGFAASGNAILGGNVTSTGDQTYTGTVALTTDATLNAGTGKIDLQGAVDAAGHALGLTSSNAATDAVRTGAAIANASQLTITGKSTLATGITTPGAQLYSDTVTLGSSSDFVASSLGFGNGIAAGTFDLGLRSDALTLAGAVSGSGNVILSPLTQGATIGVAGGTGTLQLSQASLDAFSGFASITVGRSDGTGDLSFGNLVLPTNLSVLSGSGDAGFTGTLASAAGQGRNLSIATGGTVTFGGAVGGAIGGSEALGNLSIAGATQLNAGVTANGTVSLAGPVTVGADATVSASAVSLGSTLDVGSRALTLLSDSLTVAGPATGSGAGSVRIAPKDAAGSMGLGGGAGTLQVSQGLIDTFAGVPTLTLGRGDSTGTITAGTLTLPTDLAIANGSGAVAFTGSIDSAAGPARDLTVTTTGATSFAGTVGTVRALDTLSVSGSSQIGAAIVTTGAQNYTGPATLASDSTLTGPSVSFGSTVDGAHALTVNATATSFAGAVGGTAALTSLTTDAAGTTQLGGNVTTSGSQAYNDALLLNGDAVLGGSTLSLAGSVDGAHTLAINGGTGVTLGGPIGAGTALAGLSVTGPLQLSAGSVSTTGAQSYAGATTLGAATTLSASSIAFGSSLDGGFALTTQSAGPTSFAGSIGATTSLASLTAGGGGTVQLAGASVDTTGAQSYSGALQLTGNSRLTGSALTLTGPVSGAADLTLHTNSLAGGSSIAGSGVLTIAPLDAALSIGVAGGAGSLQVSQATLDGASGFSAHVIGRADGSGTLTSGNLTLRANTTLQTAAGDLNLASVDGAFALTLNSGGTTRITGPVGAATPLTSLTTDNNAAAADWNGTAGERTTFDTADGTGAARVITSGAQTYNDPVTATVPVAFSGGAITATQAANRFDGVVSANAISLDLHNSAELRLGTLTLVNGGSLETDGVLHITGAVQLNGGVLTLTSHATPTSIDLTDPEYAGKTVLFGFVPIKEASPTIVQDAGGTVATAAGSMLVLRAPTGGSISLEQPGNGLLGQVSAVTGTLGDNDTSRFDGATGVLTLGFLRIVSSEIHVAGRPPASGDQTLQQAGLEADVIKLTADVLTTGPDGLIRARLPFNNIQGSQTSLPGLTLAMTPTALANGGGFGGPESDNFIQVQVGGDEGGFLTARPKGTSGDTAVIFLGGDSSVTPFYDGSGKISEIRIFYNGDAPRTPQETGALAAVLALIEDARQARVEEAVRTENVRSRLRSGVIAEVGAGRPATVGRESIRLPDTCEIKPKTLLCE